MEDAHRSRTHKKVNQRRLWRRVLVDSMCRVTRYGSSIISNAQVAGPPRIFVPLGKPCACSVLSTVAVHAAAAVFGTKTCLDAVDRFTSFMFLLQWRKAECNVALSKLTKLCVFRYVASMFHALSELTVLNWKCYMPIAMPNLRSDT